MAAVERKQEVALSLIIRAITAVNLLEVIRRNLQEITRQKQLELIHHNLQETIHRNQQEVIHRLEVLNLRGLIRLAVLLEGIVVVVAQVAAEALDVAANKWLLQ